MPRTNTKRRNRAFRIATRRLLRDHPPAMVNGVRDVAGASQRAIAATIHKWAQKVLAGREPHDAVMDGIAGMIRAGSEASGIFHDATSSH
jgi:hypothetical protein